MVVTHAQMQKKKETPIYVKEDDPSRKHMKKADALVKNKRLREDRIKMERYAAGLKEDREKEEKPKDGEDSSNVKEIAKLEKQLAKERGPGSKARKEKIQAKIDELKG